MKKLLMIFGLMTIMTSVGYAETWYVKVDVFTGKRIALFKFKDGDILKDTNTCAYAEITKANYVESQTQFADWKKTQANQDKVNVAVADKKDDLIADYSIEIGAIDKALESSIGKTTTKLTEKKSALQDKINALKE